MVARAAKPLTASSMIEGCREVIVARKGERGRGRKQFGGGDWDGGRKKGVKLKIRLCGGRSRVCEEERRVQAKENC